MGLKFRRGTTAQQSGSLAFGEPYVNTTLGTLLIGGPNGDIVLSSTGTGSTGNFGAISGSGLDITGNANIAGNLTLGGTITIGDAATDNVVVNADLSSSIIPNDDNAFDLGSTSKRYRAIHGTNIYGAINATNGVISGSSQLNTLATTGSNTFKGNQTIIGSGAGFAAYISTSVNDATLGLDTTANVNALYFLKNGEKNFELSYDTTNANGIFRLLPYDNNSFFEIGNPSNSGANYVFISEPTYGNVLIGPGIGNGVSSLVGSTPATDKVQVTGNLYVSGAISANSFTGSIAATNGVVSGSSQVVGILTSLNSFTASNNITSLNAFSASENTKSETLRLYTASVDTKFTSLATYTGSNDTTNTTQNTRLSRIEESTSSLNAYTASNNTTNTLQTTRIDQLAAGTASVNLQTASVAGHITDINTYTSSLKTAFSVSGTDLTVIGNLTVQGDTVTLNVSNLLVEDKVIEIASGSTTSAAANGAGIFISGANASILWDNASSTLDINKSIDVVGNVTLTGTVDGVDVSVQDTLYTNKFSTLQTLTASMAAQVSRLQESTASLNAFSASENTKSETLRLYTASIDGKFSTLATYTGSNDTTNTTQNTRLTRLEESTASINLTTSSLATTYEGRATAAKTIFSGSSQVVGSAITTNTITIGSTSTALGGTSTTLAGLTSVSSTGFTGALTGNASTATTLQNARTINGTSFDGSANITIANLVSGSSQITAGSTTNFATDVKTQLNSNTVVSSSVQIDLTATSNYIGGILTRLNAVGVVSGSKTISGITLGSNLATLTIGTGLSGTSYNGSTGVTIANTGVLSVTTNTGLSTNASATGNITITNTGVTSNVAGTGISVSGATGAVTITNSGVTSIVAGTGVSRDSATGAVTISIGQAVATSSNVQFNSLGIGMAASATAGRIDATNDIVAYSSSDIRFKENIKPIENALQKISKISGNTYDWKAENKIEHGYEGNDVGVIAQEIEEVLPQLVQTRENGYKAVKYDKLVALLIEGIKEQQTQIHSLTIEIEKLKESKGL